MGSAKIGYDTLKMGAKNFITKLFTGKILTESLNCLLAK
jgi:hypothetical protein